MIDKRHLAILMAAATLVTLASPWAEADVWDLAAEWGLNLDPPNTDNPNGPWSYGYLTGQQDTFLRGIHVVSYDEAALRDSAEHVLALSAAEDLPAHGAAVAARFDALPDA